MRHDGNLRFNESSHGLGSPPFDLDRLSAAFLDEAQCPGDGPLLPEMERAVRHVRDQQRALNTSLDRFDVVEHLVQGH